MQASLINQYKIIIFFALGILSFSCKKKDDKTNCSEYVKPGDTYIYPVLPGTPSWANLKPDEKLAVCQIPVNILGSLSTESLIQSWIDYPLNYEITLGTNLQTGIEFFIQNFSGLQEICKRNDAGSKLLERYQNMNSLCIRNIENPTKQANYSLDFLYLEMVVAQDTILRKLSLDQKKLLASEILKKFNEKKMLKDYYGSIAAGATLFTGMKTMKSANYAPFLQELGSGNSLFLNTFMNSAIIPTNDLNASELTIILNHLQNFIK